MVFWLVKLKSESSWISVCPSPKYQFFIEVFLGKSLVLLEVNASQLAARRGAWARSVCLVRVWEPGKARVGFDEWVFWARASAVPGCWPQLCPFPPSLMSTQSWTSFGDNLVELEHLGARACSTSVPIDWEMHRSTWNEISRNSHGSL